MAAQGSSICWRNSRASSGLAASRAESAAEMRSRISAAAAFVRSRRADDQHRIRYRIEQALDDALDEHRRFAGACRRADKQHAAARSIAFFDPASIRVQPWRVFLLFQAFERLGVR